MGTRWVVPFHSAYPLDILIKFRKRTIASNFDLEYIQGKTSNKWVGGVLKLSPTSEQRVWYSQILYTASDTTYVTRFSLFAKYIYIEKIRGPSGPQV